MSWSWTSAIAFREHPFRILFGRCPQRPRVARPVAGEPEPDAVDDLGVGRQDGRIADPQHPEVAVVALLVHPGEAGRPVVVRQALAAVERVGREARSPAARCRRPRPSRRTAASRSGTAEVVEHGGDTEPGREREAERGRYQHTVGSEHGRVGRPGGPGATRTRTTAARAPTRDRPTRAAARSRSRAATPRQRSPTAPSPAPARPVWKCRIGENESGTRRYTPKVAASAPIIVSSHGASRTAAPSVATAAAAAERATVRARHRRTATPSAKPRP